MLYQKPPFSEVLPLHLRKRRSKYQPPSSEVLHFRGHHFRGFTVHEQGFVKTEVPAVVVTVNLLNNLTFVM